MVEGSKLTKHSKISYIKSGIRIVGFAFIPVPHFGLITAAVILILAEGFGIWEELGATY